MMVDEAMLDNQMEEHHDPDVIFVSQNDTSQNNQGSGSSAFSSEHSGSATLSDSAGSTNRVMGVGVTNTQRASDLLFGFSVYAEPMKTKIIDCAFSAMDELCKIGVAGKPLWQPHKTEKYEILNDIEYLKQFGQVQVDATLREIIKLVEVGEPQNLPSFGGCQTQDPSSNSIPRGSLQLEASRDVALVKMSAINVVELLMDVNEWTRAFYDIVSRIAILGTLSDGVVQEGGYDGKLHVINAELHLPSPFVPTRQCYFARYCKQLSPENWVVADVSLEKFFPCRFTNFRRRPSGCLITAMPNGYSKVIWVEHVEADHRQLNNHFQTLLTSGSAFGATRWLASFIRHREWTQTLQATKFVADSGVLIPQTGRTSFLKLADRMMRSFCANVSGTSGNPWMQIAAFPGSTDVRVMVKNNVEDTVMPLGTTVVLATSLWLQVSPNRLFNFLRHPNSRNKWDLLSSRLSIQEVAYMIKGENAKNRVSLMRAITPAGKTEIFYLQESSLDSTSSYVTYAPIDELAVASLASGCNPDKVIILPSGFSILPGVLPGEDSGTGSLLTIAFHIVESATVRPIPSDSVATAYNIITNTVTAIRDAVNYHNFLNNWIED